MKFVSLILLVSSLSASPVLARTPMEKAATPPELRFLDCDHHYWVHRGFNDALYYGGGGSLNSAQSDRFQSRREGDRQLQLGPWRSVKTPIITEWIEKDKVLEFPLESKP